MGRIVLWNPAAERIFGYTVDQIVGKPIALLIPEELRGRHRAGMAHFAVTGHGELIDTGTPMEVPALRKDGSRITIELTLHAIRDIALPGRYAVGLARDVSEWVRRRERLDAVVHAVRRLATRSDTDTILRELLEEAAALVGAEFGIVRRWDEARQRLVCVLSTQPGLADFPPTVLGEGMSGRAAQKRVPVIENDFWRRYPERPAAGLGVSAAASVPLLHEGRLLGTLTVDWTDRDRAIDADDVSLLELLASLAAATLVSRTGGAPAGA